MRNVPLAEVDALPRAVLAISTDYPPEHVLPAHRHRRAQFLYGATGSMRVETADGSWTVPTRRAVLIPPETDHRVVMSNVTTRSLYLEPSAVPWFPRRCRAVDVSPLLRELLRAAVDVAPEYPRRGRDATLISLLLHEVSRCAPLPLELPWPRHEGLRARCQSFSDAPDVHDPPSRWAAELHVSERTLHRMFRAETGLSFALAGTSVRAPRAPAARRRPSGRRGRRDARVREPRRVHHDVQPPARHPAPCLPHLGGVTTVILCVT